MLLVLFLYVGSILVCAKLAVSSLKKNITKQIVGGAGNLIARGVEKELGITDGGAKEIAAKILDKDPLNNPDVAGGGVQRNANKDFSGNSNGVRINNGLANKVRLVAGVAEVAVAPALIAAGLAGKATKRVLKKPLQVGKQKVFKVVKGVSEKAGQVKQKVGEKVAPIKEKVDNVANKVNEGKEKVKRVISKPVSKVKSAGEKVGKVVNAVGDEIASTRRI